MTNAEPTSTDSTSSDLTTERSEKTESQPSLIAVSEENLAALLRATTDAIPEPEAQEQATAVEAQKQDQAAVPVAKEEVKESPAVEEAVVSAPVPVVESRRALFASVKEHRSEILRAAITPEPAAQQEYPVASLPQEAAPIHVTLPKTQPVIAAEPVSTDAPSSRMGLVAAGIIGALVLVVGIFFLWPKGHPAKTPAVVTAAVKDSAPLQLLAQPLESGLTNVRWNAQSSAIAQARDGRLVITERDKAPRIMALDVAQLQVGHLTYQSTADSIQFDLEVNDRSGGVAKESILSLSSPAGAAPQTPREPVATVKPQGVPQAAPAKIQAAAPAVVQPTVDVPPQTQTPVKARTFVPPPTQQKREQSAVIDVPPALASVPAAPVGVSMPVPLAPIAAPPTASPKQIQVESTLQAANLIKRVVPVYPLLARSAGIQGIVKFTALIGKDGKIANLKLLSGPTPLVDAASDAVRKWLYRPTLLNGQPVEVITQINVNFTITGEAR